MPARLRHVVHLLQLARIEQVVPAVSNIWLVIFLAYKIEPEKLAKPMADYSLPVALLLGCGAATGLSLYGLAINDVLDARHDRAFAPERPIAGGRVGLTTALVLATLSLMAAFLAANFMGNGSTFLCLLTAGGILFYNTMGKYIPAVGIIAVGLIFAVNMYIPCPRFDFVWPIWLSMSHVMLCATIIHQLQGKRPRLRTGDWWGVLAGWLFWTLALFAMSGWHTRLASNHWPGVWAWPGAAVLLFLILSYRILGGHMRPLRERRAAAARFARLAGIMLFLYDAGWLIGLGAYWQAGVILGLMGTAVGLVELVAALAHLVEPEATYRVESPARF